MDDADPVEEGIHEVEAGVAMERDGSASAWEIPVGYAWGVETNLEFSGSASWLRADDGDTVSGVSGLSLGAKWRFVQTGQARHAVAPSITMPWGDEELGGDVLEAGLAWIGSFGIHERCGLHATVGYRSVLGEDDAIDSGVAVDWQALPALQWVAEVVVETIPGGDDWVGATTGLRWSADNNVVIDIAGGASLAGEGPDYTWTGGLTWWFGGN